MTGFFETRIEYLKGVGPQKAALLNKELDIFTFGEMLQYYPFRYEDRTKFYKIKELHPDLQQIQVIGKITTVQTVGEGRKKRLVAQFSDETGSMDLTWFKGVQWISRKLVKGVTLVAFGKPQLFGSRFSMAHPELEPLTARQDEGAYFQPVYPTTETLKHKYLDSRGISKILAVLLPQALSRIPETLPDRLCASLQLLSRPEAIREIHFPSSQQNLKKAVFRLKFEEFFFLQLRLLKLKLARTEKFRGRVLSQTDLLTRFYKEHLPFELTEAQKRVIKEIYADLKSGLQMNRLIQGDVGSGKTIVAFICLLVAVDSGYQTCLMAPTEILANQHLDGLKPFTEQMGLKIALLTGSSTKRQRETIHRELESGEIHLLIGTHALLEDVVVFRQLGLAIIDEQHRFGVAQRAKLWAKNKDFYPHVLVMTATPIPRTLAMTLYGDLDISVIDELPAGRKPIQTVHRYDKDRLKVFGFLRKEITKGRQVYIVYPLIEESEKSDLKSLIDGYESICRAFADLPVGILHGNMKATDKDFEMARFVKGETKIMVATTVIEVGVNVPNATVMVIENAERFGLSQLHQLRGRVGRGSDQSYCILMSKYELSKDSRIRLETMVRTNNGFEIADVDLRLRGPGDLSGTQQSGLMDLKLGDLGKDGAILAQARSAAKSVLDSDPELSLPEHRPILDQVARLRKNELNWSRIS
ncbi:ATP-dependent DNA helicase RecG [Cyclobacterium lianum]|uniref:ATP-dependent DNA helicase RecG n=1 Tax=Cyclobacterium lianum TaxID=388280 RepID=A0A1M7HZD4_9BACT|nr:ATP-dependent DNA helicase RecG [Cyclobacterium lianum]SHM33497.1 ATP-dependent DNA helicase RecG [Cyclobacterium lianum]